MKTYALGNWFGIELSALPSVRLGAAGLWLALSLLALVWLGFGVGEAIVWGALAAVLHYVCAVLHQVGHALSARRVGYPMSGIRLWGVLSTSLYPENEPELPAAIHIQRALGGPLFSLLIAILTLLFIAVVPFSSPFMWYLLRFFFADNLLVFALGSFVPLGFTDGSTILYWRGRR
jgi:Zn-dependent protease